MKYVLVDVETTGLFDFKKPADDPSQPRLCEFAAITLDADLNVEGEFEMLVKPDGWTVPPETAAIHKLTTERLLDEGRPVAEALDYYEALIVEGRGVIAYGAQFDCKALRSEFRRAGRPDLFHLTRNWCAMKAATPVAKIPPTAAMMARGRKTWKTPKLVEAYEALVGIAPQHAHTALGDCRMTAALVRAMVRDHGVSIDCQIHLAKEGA